MQHSDMIEGPAEPSGRGRGRRGGRRGGRGRERGYGGRNSPAGGVENSAAGREPACNGTANQQDKREMSLGQLRGLAEDDGVKILQRLSIPEMQDAFNMLTCERELDEARMCLVVRVLAKLSVVEYQPLVASLFCRVCRQEFLNRLLLHIVQLSLTMEDAATTADFYRDFCRLCHGIVKLIPMLAWDKLDNMVRKAGSELTQLPPFEGADEISKELGSIRAKLAVEKERMVKDPPPQSSRSKWRTDGYNSAHKFRFDEMTPPDDFRKMPVFPTVEDITDPEEPYLRRALERGPYRDADHYLDVHFRLLREDFVRPLREGIVEYCKKMAEMQPGSKRPRIQNLRVYEDVCFNALSSEDDQVALEVVFDPELNGLAQVNWEYSRRLIRGSLLVFARDLSFSSIVLATVSKRDVTALGEGRLTVELCEPGVGEDLFASTFVMLECINFFGAYLHPMRALQALDEASLPLREYLVEGSSARAVPDYLRAAAARGVGLRLPAGDDAAAPAALLRDPSRPADWPSPDSLGLDESQHRAMQGALTNKVMLVQGPPGTGKTYLGLRVARTLLANSELWRSKDEPRPLLVICSTNHALDQFMLGLLPYTDSLVRVGNPCREKALEHNDIYYLRKQRLPGAYALYGMIKQHRDRFRQLKELHERVRECLSRLRGPDAGIVSPETLHAFGIITEAQLKFFEKWPLERWLLGNCPLPDDDVQETVWGGAQAALSYLLALEGMDTGALWRTVRLAVSGHKLQANLLRLMEEDDEVGIRALRLLQETISARMTAWDTRPDGMQAGMALVAAAALAHLPEPRRWKAYRSWHEELLNEMSALAEEISIKHSEGAQLVQECRMVQDHTIMSKYMIICMSASYAAMRHRILKQLKPRIVIVEEAAEVLEAGVVVSLGTDVEHLVMIGDHQQLRPKTSVQELAKEYHFDVSLFERFVNNGVHCVTLNTQHRMRPEVARLICPNIYPNLLNHESVNHFPSIRGITKNVFFLDHRFLEEEPKFLRDSNSMQNSHEAFFASALVRYFLLQGYEPAKITVLCTYKAQLYFLTKQLRPEDAHLKDVRITAVDDYQGEENDIVVLSLVRSNNHQAVGYVGIGNRVCVALSRARHGFYMVGNMSTLTARSDSVWRGVRDELESQGAVGTKMELRCEVHGTLTAVSSAEDFEKCPQGGCLKLCGVTLSCGHLCPQLCHPLDQEHRTYKCQSRCREVVCPRGHQCLSRCFEKCPPCSVLKVEELPCGHTAKMPCHQDPEEHDCQVTVEVALPECGHSLAVKCFQLGTPAALVCARPCIFRRDCGHVCDRKCHVLDDPRHEESLCTRPCEETRQGCCGRGPGAHLCRRLCHEECEPCEVPVTKILPCNHRLLLACGVLPADEMCTKRCRRALPCGHICGNKCREPCGPCMVQVNKVLPRCGHTRPVACSVDPAEVSDCTGPCLLRLSCGHPCSLRCCDPCADCRCQRLVPYRGRAACGHQITVPCSSSYDPDSFELLLLCEEPCRQELECGHSCTGSCGRCLQGRLHAACASKCGRPLICGHICEQPCAASCPPCGKPCSVRCSHSRCSKRCSEPCAPCKERCPRACRHRKCSSLCGVLCPEGPCEEPCPEMLPCGHSCAGMCGEECLCRSCGSSNIEMLFGTEEEEDARFVTLPDCKHVFEVTSLDKWMTMDNEGEESEEEIKQKVCPKCKTVVATSMRYSNVIKRNAANVARIKEQLYRWETIKPVVVATRELLKAMPVLPSGLPALSELVQVVDGALSRVEKSLPSGKRRARKGPTLSLTAVQSLQQYAVVLSELSKLLAQSQSQADARPLLSAKKAELEAFVENLCGEYKKRGEFLRISTQEAADINAELARGRRLLEVCHLESCLAQGFVEATGLQLKLMIVSRIVRRLKPCSKADGERADALLRELAAASRLLVSREEVRAVTAALGLAQGHWYLCPNGHPYCITECGGAMEESNCNECGARIGGRNHRLRSDNSLGTRIDGATRPAWPGMM